MSTIVELVGVTHGFNGVTKIVYGTKCISNPDRKIVRRRPPSACKRSVILSPYRFGPSAVHNLRDTVHGSGSL